MKSNCAKEKQYVVGVLSELSLITRPCCFSLLAASLMLHSVAMAKDTASAIPAYPTMAEESLTNPSTAVLPAVTPATRRAHFNHERASDEARKMADWVVDSDDNSNMPFAIVDKIEAKVFVFFADGRLRGTAPALLGLAVGDKAIPGIGNRPLSSIGPDERTTPAGRFVAALDHNLKGKEILWVDYDHAISMHPVVTSKPKERRLQRLNTATPLDNRISYGCINVPAKFFADVVRPSFTGTNGIVYVLPETKPFNEVFESYTEAGKND